MKSRAAHKFCHKFSIEISVLSSVLAFASCGNHKTPSSSVKILDGKDLIADNDLTKPVVKLKIVRGEDGFACTGTFVNPTTLLTAAHCVQGVQNPSDITVEGKATAASFFSNTSYSKKESAYAAFVKNYSNFRNQNRKALDAIIKKTRANLELSEQEQVLASVYVNLLSAVKDSESLRLEADQAVIVINSSDSNKFDIKKYYSLVKQPIEKDAGIFLVGFGAVAVGKSKVNDEVIPIGSGKKRYGFNIVDSVREYDRGFNIIFDRNLRAMMPAKLNISMSSIPLQGDSGGPVISCPGFKTANFDPLKNCDSFQVAGLVSAGKLDFEGPVQTAFMSSVTSLESRKFFKSAIECKSAVCAKNFL